MGVTEAPRSPLRGGGAAETEAALAPRSLHMTLGREAADGQQEEMGRHRTMSGWTKPQS